MRRASRVGCMADKLNQCGVGDHLHQGRPVVCQRTLQCSVDRSSRTISQTSRGTQTRLKLPASGKHEGCAATARTRQGSVLFSTTIDGYALSHLSTSPDAFQMPKYQERADTSKAKKKWPWILAASLVLRASSA